MFSLYMYLIVLAAVSTLYPSIGRLLLIIMLTWGVGLFVYACLYVCVC